MYDPDLIIYLSRIISSYNVLQDKRANERKKKLAEHSINFWHHYILQYEFGEKLSLFVQKKIELEDISENKPLFQIVEAAKEYQKYCEIEVIISTLQYRPENPPPGLVESLPDDFFEKYKYRFKLGIREKIEKTLQNKKSKG